MLPILNFNSRIIADDGFNCWGKKLCVDIALTLYLTRILAPIEAPLQIVYISFISKSIMLQISKSFIYYCPYIASPCIKKEGWSGDLTLQILNEMMNIFLGVRWGATYIFAPQCPNLHTRGHIFVSGGRKHAEDSMAAQCGLPTEFYLISAPCPDCAMMLYNKYKAKDYKPLVHIARPYQEKGKSGSEGNKRINLHCLAMLMDAGFTIVPWNWISFEHDYITNADCTEAINEMTSDSDSPYNMRYHKAMTAIQQAVNIMMTWSHDHNYRICKDATNTINNERYTSTERVAVNLVDNERYTASSERYATELERYVANNERYTANDERYTANNERYTANNERYTANEVSNEKYPFMQ